MSIFRKLLPRFSWRTLVIFPLLVTCEVALWLHWEPWCFDVVRFEDGWIEKGTPHSPDGTRVLKTKPLPLPVIRDRETDAELWVFWGGLSAKASFLDDDTVVVGSGASEFWRRRPEWWWGVFWLWEFWLTVAFAGLFIWSVVRDRQSRKRRDEPTQ